MYKTGIKSMQGNGNKLNRTESLMKHNSTLCWHKFVIFVFNVLHRILSSDPNIFAQFGLTCAEKYH